MTSKDLLFPTKYHIHLIVEKIFPIQGAMIF